jgi:hypothetical protein
MGGKTGFASHIALCSTCAGGDGAIDCAGRPSSRRHQSRHEASGRVKSNSPTCASAPEDFCPIAKKCQRYLLPRLRTVACRCLAFA